MGYYACVILNPASANGSTGRKWPMIRAEIDRVLDRWDNQVTLERGDATRLARQAVLDGYEMIVCVGGDGTMNEVVTGLLEVDGARPIPQMLRSDIIVASVRQGTGGDFARFLGIPCELPRSVSHLAGERARPTDLGYVEFLDHDGVETAKAFLNISSFGLSGVVDDRVNRASKMLGGKASFLLGLGRALVEYRPQAVRVEVDGERFYDDRLVTCAVANGQYFGGGMRIAPRAAIDDGLFDVVVQTRAGVREVLSIGDLYSGRVADWTSVRSTRGKVVVATPSGSDDVVLVDIDGEQPGKLPAMFRILPSALRVKIA